jgi:chromosome segregation ATPase
VLILSGGFRLSNQKLQDAIKNIQEYVASLQSAIKDKDAEILKMKNKLDKIQEQKSESELKLAEMESEMEQLSSVYEELKQQKDMEINLQEVMRLYVILTEQVLDGNAHIRLLTLLHGKKETMTKEELSKASGIMPAQTLRAIFALRNHGLVTFDENTEEVKLVRRLFN